MFKGITGHAAKSWSTNIGAFGTTERKFSSFHNEQTRKETVPGPGQYPTNTFVQKKYTQKRVKG